MPVPHIRRQLAPYTQTVRVLIKDYGGGRFWVERVVPTIRYDAPVPHGRNDADSLRPEAWGPDAYGYTDCDDYHLALFGA